MNAALVIIDVQQAMFSFPNYRLHDGEATVARIGGVIAKARAAGMPVLYVQHDGGEVNPLLAAGAPGFAYHAAIAPLPGDDVTVKRYPSAFRETDFEAKLKRLGADHLVVCGMQSEYCIDSAVRGAAERGLKVTLVSDGHSTFDSKVLKAGTIIAHQNETLSGSFAVLKAADEIEFGAGG